MNEAGRCRPCCVFKGESCDLRQEDGSPSWQCAVCKEVAHWVEDGAELVCIRASGQTGAVVFPANRTDDVSGALFTLNTAVTSAHELRETIHDVLRVADAVWIEQPGQRKVQQLVKGPTFELPE